MRIPPHAPSPTGTVIGLIFDAEIALYNVFEWEYAQFECSDIELYYKLHSQC